MTSAPLIDAQHAAFLQSGVSICVSARDRMLLPTLARASGCSVSTDRRRIAVFISATQAALVLECLRDNGAISAVFSQPSTHRTLQVKGTDAVVGTLEQGDLHSIEQYRSAFARELQPLGFPEILIQTLFSYPPSDIVRVSFTPSDAFLQTPGPRAGEPLQV